jgi:hypothetical protein
MAGRPGKMPYIFGANIDVRFFASLGHLASATILTRFAMPQRLSIFLILLASGCTGLLHTKSLFSEGGQFESDAGLELLSTSTGSNHQEVALALTWPRSASANFTRLGIWRNPQASGVPDCDTGTEVKLVENEDLSLTEVVVDDTDTDLGLSFSYRVCLYDIDANSWVTRDEWTSGNVAAKDALAIGLSSFSATAGASHGSIGVTIGLASTTTDIATLSLRRSFGSTAPASCSAGTLVAQQSSGFGSGSTITADAYTTTNPPELVSYRVCVTDAAGNTSSLTSTNVQGLDTQPPPVSESALVLESGQTCVIPTIRTGAIESADIDVVEFLGSSGGMPPNCGLPGNLLGSLTLNGTASNSSDLFYFSLSHEFDDPIGFDATGMTVYNYRVCFYDKAGNVTTAALMTDGATANPGNPGFCP